MKKGLVVILTIVAVVAFYFFLNLQLMEKDYMTEYNNMPMMNLSEVKDGVYRGNYKRVPVDVHVEVEIKAGSMVSHKVRYFKVGPGYEAKEMTPRILNAQQPKVDAITGATASSMGIMIATYRALQKGVK